MLESLRCRLDGVVRFRLDGEAQGVALTDERQLATDLVDLLVQALHLREAYATATATAAATAQATELVQSKSFTFKLSLDSSILSNASTKAAAEAALKNDLCVAAQLSRAQCAALVVTTSTAGVTSFGDIVLAAQVARAGDNIITLGAVTLESLERVLGATAPAGTSIVGAIGLSGRDAQGRKVFGPSTGFMRLTLNVDASQVLSGTPAGDLKAAGWDSTARRWVFIPAQSVANADGSFTLTADVEYFGVVATIYVPGAGQIAAFNGYSAHGAGFGVFAGSPVTSTLGHAAALNQADGVWLQDEDGSFRLLIIGGPAFLVQEFEAVFARGIAPNTAVTLVQTRS